MGRTPIWKLFMGYDAFIEILILYPPIKIRSYGLFYPKATLIATQEHIKQVWMSRIRLREYVRLYMPYKEKQNI